MDTVQVKFTTGWFAPSEQRKPDAIRIIKGRFFRKGIQEVPKELLEFLPKSAKIVDENYKEPDEKVFNETIDFSAIKEAAKVEEEVLVEAGYAPKPPEEVKTTAAAKKLRPKSVKERM